MKNICSKELGEIRHGDRKVAEVEIPDQSILEIVSTMSSYMECALVFHAQLIGRFVNGQEEFWRHIEPTSQTA